MRGMLTDPMMQGAAPQVQAVPVASSLAAALMGRQQSLNLPPPSMGIPLSSIAGLLKGFQGPQTSSATSSDPNLIWNPNNPVGTEKLGGATANQGSMLNNAAATYAPQAQGWLARLFGGGGSNGVSG